MTLAEHLYKTFWERNKVEVPPFSEQAPAIVSMWKNIALSVETFKEE